ncbi:MAG: AAA family ATPase [Firmicutes bacterium]|jgi:cell division protease FtsH|nr:AAA family ATPase [Candidatus Fermentithermobacillaceae bacterium]
MKKLEILAGVAAGLVAFLALRGLNLFPWLLLAGLTYFLVTSRGQLGDIGRKKVGAVVSHRPQVTFEDVGGQRVAKRELMEALQFLKDYDRARRLGIRPLKGILLAGPPGTGKTLLAKAAANYTDSAFISASGSEFIEVYAGLGAQRVRGLFEKARKLARSERKTAAIIFIDEIEVLAGRRGAQVGHLEYDQTLNQLLVEMDGLKLDDDVRILMIGATNRPDLLDAAILRPGRFDRTVRVDLPDREGRCEILNLHLKNKPLSPEVSIDTLARETFGLSGAHLESLCNEAAILALRKGNEAISQDDLEEALDKILMGEKLEKLPSPEEIHRVAVHEAGHAVVSEALRPGSVAQVTVSPRGNALGFVRHAPKDDTYVYPRETIEEEICILIAGAGAEEMFFGSKSTTASNDFQRALDLAKRIVSYGMSPLGVVDRDTASPEVLAKATREILDRCHDRTASILKKHRMHIKEIAQALMKRESMPGDELRSLLQRDYPGRWRWRKLPSYRGKLTRKVEEAARG